MNAADLLGAPVSDQPDLEPRLGSSCAPPAPIETISTPPQTRRLLVATLLLAGLIVGGAIGWFARSGSSESAIVALKPAATAPEQQVGGVAELFTALYLAGVTPPDGLTTVPPPDATHGTWVNQTATLDVSARPNGLWNVLVVVDSLELGADQYEPVELQYFSVTVSNATGRPVVVAPPARVPPPATASHGLTPAFAEAVPPDQRAAITEFLTGYLTGSQDVARYMTPTARIQLFSQPPYVSIAIGDFGANELGQISVSLTAQTESGASHSLGYVVDTAFTSGVWEVADIVSGPGSR